MITILICTIPSRKPMLDRLIERLQPQLYTGDFILINAREDGEIGTKRNELVSMCTTEYCCFVDDDDLVSTDYIDRIYDGIDLDVDRILIQMDSYLDGEFEERSIPRQLGHLHPMKTSIYKRFPFKDISNGEDTDFTHRVIFSGEIKSEYVSEAVYEYYFVNDPNKDRSLKKKMSWDEINKSRHESSDYMNFLHGNTHD